MNDKICALLVEDQEGCFAALKQTLAELGVETSSARNCVEARVSLKQPNSPQLVFAGAALPDGSWRELCALAGRIGKPTPVIVVSRLADIRLYIDALEGGVSDFIAPPFRPQDIAWVVHNALRRGSDPDHSPPAVVGSAGAHRQQREIS